MENEIGILEQITRTARLERRGNHQTRGGAPSERVGPEARAIVSPTLTQDCTDLQ